MKNLSLKDCPLRSGLFFGLAALILAGVGTMIFPPNASGQSETRIISVNTNLNFGKIEIDGLMNFGVTIANQGNTDLTISNINLPDGFSALIPWEEGFISFVGGLESIIIPAGGQTNIFVMFQPTNVMHYSGTATIDSDATSGNDEFTVSGDGTYPIGRYIGLFSPTTNAAFENSGYFSLNLGAKGEVSGVLRLAGATTPFSGRFPSSGTFSGSITQKSGGALEVSFQTNPGLLHGVISNDTWSADLFAYRELPRLKSRKAGVEATPSQYHFQIAGSTDPLMGPTNDGVGTMDFTSFHTVRLKGTLADGTAFSQGASAVGGYHVPFYASLYHRQGAVMGWIDLQFVPTNLPGSGLMPPTNPPISGIIPLTNIVLRTNGTGIDYFTNPILILPPTNLPPIIITNLPITNFPPIILTNVPPFVPITNLPPFTNFPPVTNIQVIIWVPPAVPPLLPPSANMIGLLSDVPRGGVPAAGLTVPGTTNRISGSINWFKPAQIDSNYPDGFSLETTVSGPTD